MRDDKDGSNFPTNLKYRRAHGGMFREIEVVHHLATALPEGFEIYHSVITHLTSLILDNSMRLILSLWTPAEGLLMGKSRQKLLYAKRRLFKIVRQRRRISWQCHYQYSAMRSRLDAAGLSTTMTSCLVLPDYTILDDHIVAMPTMDYRCIPRLNSSATTYARFLNAGHGCNDIVKLRHFYATNFTFPYPRCTARTKSQPPCTASDGWQLGCLVFKLQNRSIGFSHCWLRKDPMALSLLEESCVKCKMLHTFFS